MKLQVKALERKNLNDEKNGEIDVSTLVTLAHKIRSMLVLLKV
ncbi:hypothetical protein CI610_03673 [invertebrate metagenome]|uniref:Uncharacterized protein n=1 Tax=invertebrate metagenome TaxID=1711999 RepID=A0A2H9T2G6_9ZZZZ